MTTPFIGEITMFGFNFAPRNYAMCNGQTLAINTNQALFSLLGTMYGGNGTTNFQLPDLRSRTPVHRGQGAGLSVYTLGQKTGVETVSLTAAQNPQHTHQFYGSTAPAQRKPVEGGTFSADTDPNVDYLAPSNAPGSSYVTLSAASLATQGTGSAHSNMQPFSVTNFCIAIGGIFPTRN